MLEAIEDEEHASVAEVADQLRVRIALATEREADGLGDGRRHCLGRFHPREGDDEGAVLERVYEGSGSFQRQAGRAAASGTDER